LSKYLVAFAVFALSAGVAHAVAGDKAEILRFKPGKPVVIADTLKGYQLNIYQFVGRSGQTLMTTFKPSNKSCYYAVDGIVGRRFLFNSKVDVGNYSGPLPSNGDYQIKVYQMDDVARRKATCTFSLTLEIRN
jgi:hypothetical protein